MYRTHAAGMMVHGTPAGRHAVMMVPRQAHHAHAAHVVAGGEAKVPHGPHVDALEGLQRGGGRVGPGRPDNQTKPGGTPPRPPPRCTILIVISCSLPPPRLHCSFSLLCELFS